MKSVFLTIILGCLFTTPGIGEETHRNHGAGIKTDVLLKTTRSWDHSLLPTYPQGQPEISILKIEIPPGMQLPLHQHPVINAGILLKGKLTVETEDGKFLYLKEGDTIAEVVDKWHHGKNEGDEPVEILVFYAGVEGKPITVKK